MRQREISTFSKRITILIGLGVVGAMAFGLAISFYRNLLFEETLTSLTERNRELRQSIDKGLESLAYYRSAQYRDKYAKENLGRLNAGEKVLILTSRPEPISYEAPDSISEAEERKAAYEQYLQKMPVIEHWKLYFFEPEELAKLKQSF
jgi:hypothetical protein